MGIWAFGGREEIREEKVEFLILRLFLGVFVDVVF